MKKINVVGAGFAGMTIALELAKKGFEVDVYDSAARVGGLLGTRKIGDGFAEQAANALIKTEDAVQLFADIDLKPTPTLKKSKARFIFRNRPKRWPLSFTESIDFFSKLTPRLVFSKKTLHPRKDETLQNWGLRNLGPAATQMILEPAMQGIYATPISQLSAELILSPLLNRKKKKTKYKGLLAAPNGMQDLVDALEKTLKQKGVRFHLQSQIGLKDLHGPVVVATSAKSAASLLADKSSLASDLLKQVKMNSLITATCFFKNPQKKYQGFGCLIPRKAEVYTLGILMNPYIFEGRDKVYNETWVLGGDKIDELMSMSEPQLQQLITNERYKILKDGEPIQSIAVTKWTQALPVYNIDLKHVQEQLPQIPDVFLHGNYLSGIGLSKILERSKTLAQEIQNKYG
jgi:oxygen-dependent protoporphyrinogen oxidase